MTRFRKPAVVFLLAFAAAAFAQDSANTPEKTTPPASTDPQATVPSAVAAPPTPPSADTSAKPSVSAAGTDSKAYVLGAEDVVYVRVWDNQAITGNYDIRPDGMISVPLINEVKAAGMTPQQLSDDIRQRLLQFIKNPVVNVNVVKVGSKKFYIQGEVNRPGAYALVAPITVLEALSNSGGFRDFANSKKIYLLRGTQKFNFNYREVSHGKHLEQNIVIENGDQIFVP